MNLSQFKKANIGIIGCGYWANNIIKSLEEENFKNIFVYDNNQKQLNAIKSKFNYIKICKSLDELLTKDLFAALLVTPPSTHFKIGKKILKKKINLFIEKPVTLRSEHLKILIDLSNKNKCVLVSGYIYNFNVYVKYVENILKRKILGKIKYIYFERSNLGPIRNDASCIWDLASHDISTALLFFKKKPNVSFVKKYNFLKKNISDISLVGLNFGKVKVEIKSSWLNPEKIRKIIIVGEKKMLQFDEMDPFNKIKIYNKYASYPDIKKFDKSFFTPKANIYLGRTFKPKIKFVSPMKKELLNFFQNIKNKNKVNSSANHALKVMKVLEEIDNKAK